jgi:hypothetical protein
MAWEQTLAWTLMTIIGIWGAGLLSFAVNRMQISLLRAGASGGASFRIGLPADGSAYPA